MRIYLGRKGMRGKVFRSKTEPTKADHGDLFAYCIGPFITIRGAKFMLHYGWGNSACQSVSDAEKLGRRYADTLTKLSKELGIA